VNVATWIWVAFIGFVVAMLAIDLLVFHREAKPVTVREASLTTLFWVSLGLGFTILVWAWQGPTAAGEYIAGYLIEYSLSVDNIFVFVLIFSYFALPAEFQHRVLFWGILGALVFRFTFIAAGAALLDRFHFMIYVFGAFLVFTAIRMARHQEIEVHPESNPLLRVLRRFFPLTNVYHGQKFFIRENGRRFATPLFAVLVVVETTDIVFAVDSIPAIFAVTEEPFLVFSSNAFAILGLRALYFLLAGMVKRFGYLQLGLAVVLGFVGAKMLLSRFYEIPIWLSLAVIVVTLATSVIASLASEKRTAGLTPPQDVVPSDTPAVDPSDDDQGVAER
jgi:tellurite resistance protein TerC